MATNLINLDEYLSNYSKKRRIDNAIKHWVFGCYGYEPRTKEEWDKILNEFFSAPAEGKIEKKEKESIPVKESNVKESKKPVKEELFEEEE